MSSVGKAADKPGSSVLNQPIVIDNGTASIKAGFAGGSKPKVVVGTKVGRAKHMRIMPGGALEQETKADETETIYVGRKLDEHRGAFKLLHPMEHGAVVNTEESWSAMERIWEHLYSKENLSARVEEHPVLLTEAPLNPRRNREHIAEIFFETFRSPAVYLAPQAVLSLYASGRTTGVVIDVGDGVCHAVPVYEGFALPHSITRSNVAGRDVNKQLELLLRRSGMAFTTTAESDLARQIKEDACYVAFKPEEDEEGDVSTTKAPSAQYQLPDGQTVTLGNERFRAPEILFRPEKIGSEEMGVADVLTNAVMKSDLDLRATLFESVVLAGGSTMFPGFGDRFLHEVRQRAPSHIKIRISAPPERVNSAWAGGSILASLSTFKNMWVSREAYEEHGANLLHRNAL
eukprot:CAMPEP_0171297336 /NCGR_PEP_ID=MMETSP0816-20121228/6110_1 /TAXON_ID=420281 /ORGANISM="Proboscia inermis, Strain CCAP1064/1" /LENGTH=402 /DNA_ID=CAMNT_0011771571 /DNA_START=44 /DNA_END=1252 /DNA_ORIENTATION=+